MPQDFIMTMKINKKKFDQCFGQRITECFKCESKNIGFLGGVAVKNNEAELFLYCSGHWCLDCDTELD